MRLRHLLSAASLLLLHCAPPANIADGGDAGADAAPVPTWYEDIAPFAYTQCGTCHQAGGIAPFDIADGASVSVRAPIIARAVRDRTMPPMPVDNSGSCHTFQNARALTDDQIATIQNWASHGAPMGDPAHAPARPNPPATLANPDVTLDIGTDFMPEAPPGLRDEYRCFVADPHFTQDTYVTGYEVVPGDARIVHHVIVYAFDSAQGETDALTHEAADAIPGYECFGGADANGAQPIVLWAPGAGATTYPNGTGLLVPANRHVVIQVHYNLDNGTFPDRTRVRLTTAAMTSTVTRGYLAPVVNGNLNLQPGMASTTSEASVSLTALPIPVRIWGVAPHMHQLGRTLHVDATAMGSTTNRCVVDTPRWDFHWQGLWWYETPMRVSPTDSLHISCTYDTTSRTTAVHWGEGTSDEMCLAYFYVTP